MGSLLVSGVVSSDDDDDGGDGSGSSIVAPSPNIHTPRSIFSQSQTVQWEDEIIKI